MGDHTVTLNWMGDWLETTLTCTAPDNAPCRVRFDCDCEAYTVHYADDGTPWHELDGERHEGTYSETCNLRDWVEEEGEVLFRGCVRIPVAYVEWEGGYPSIVLQCGAS